jgi:L-threonylcarbamoyladenylate synthase
MNIFRANNDSIQRAAAIIRDGGLVSFPTETVYGLGADVFNPLAVSRIYEVKDRPFFDPIIVHISNTAAVDELVLSFGERARMLADRFWPGPLTLVLKKTARVPDIVTAGLETVAIRMPAHPVALQLIEYAGKPLAAPSANLFGYISPTRAAHVAEQLGERIDMVLDGGDCPVGIESTILHLGGPIPILLRPGGLPLEEIEEVVGPVAVHGGITGSVLAPGQLPSHYSPNVPVRLVDRIDFTPAEPSAALLAFRAPREKLPFARIEVLSPEGDLRVAAANLFSCLHRLDNADVDIIYVERVPEIGLGRAIMDRLRRAAGRKSH